VKALVTGNAPDDVVVTRCQFLNNDQGQPLLSRAAPGDDSAPSVDAQSGLRRDRQRRSAAQHQ
jgi:hypothetical protein